MTTRRKALWFVATLCAGCGGSSKSATNEPKPIANAAKQTLVGMVPAVDGTDVLATVWNDAKPDSADDILKSVPVLVIVDERGEYRVASPPYHWRDLPSHSIEPTRPLPLRFVYQSLAEGQGMGLPPQETARRIVEVATGPDLPSDEVPGTSMDDPPPPEEEDMPDDGEEESGGTGTAMALDEGKMGKKDSDRAEGQYRMQKNQDDPQLAAQQAKEEAHRRELEAKGFYRGGRAPSPTAKKVTRLSTSSGFIDSGEQLPILRGAAVAHPKAKAAALVKLLDEGGAESILVSNDKDVRPLRLLFGHRDGWEPSLKYWIEVRAGGGAFVVDGVPGQPARTPVSITELPAMYKALAADKRYAKMTTVDVLVDDELSVQALVDVLVALDRAGARAIAVGRVAEPGSLQASLRGK